MSSRSIGVIGAGIIGTVTACFLKRDGHDVTLYEREAPGSAASGGNSGVLSPAAVVPVSMPGLLSSVPGWLMDPAAPFHMNWRQGLRLLPWLAAFARAGREDRVHAISAALAALNGPTLTLLKPLLNEAGLESLVVNKGLLYADSGPASRLNDSLATELRQRSGHIVEFLGSQDLRDLEPALSTEFTHGVFLPESGHTTNPHRLVSGLADHFSRSGGKVVIENVGRLAVDGQALIETGGTLRRHDMAIVAAGVWSAHLLADLGYRVPLASQRGYHVTFQEPGIALNTVIMPVDAAASIVPMEMGIRIGGTVEFARPGAPVNPLRSDALLSQARLALPSLDTERHTVWMGERPCTPDSLPILGRAPHHPQVLFAFGHGHQGMIGAAGTAAIMADLVAGRHPAIDLQPFAADRFDDPLFSRIRRISGRDERFTP